MLHTVALLLGHTLAILFHLELDFHEFYPVVGVFLAIEVASSIEVNQRHDQEGNRAYSGKRG